MLHQIHILHAAPDEHIAFELHHIKVSQQKLHLVHRIVEMLHQMNDRTDVTSD
jgi:hypothetical protein